MSVDTVNYALSTVRLNILQHPDNYSEEGKERLLHLCEMMRHYLMREDVVGFNSFIDMRLAKWPDATDFILDALFEELGFPGGVREQLDAALAAV